MENKIRVVLCIYNILDDNQSPCTTILRKKVGISMPTLSSIVKELSQEEIIIIKKNNKYTFYTLTDKGKMWAKLLHEANIINEI